MARFLCTGDLHLGAGADLGSAPGGRLAEQEAAWLSIVQMANELEATILFAGDAWERRRPTPAELLAFRRPLNWLKFPLVGIAGNHDVEAFERPTGYEVFLIPGGRASVATRPGIERVADAAIALLPWAPPGKLIALDDGGDRDAVNARLADGLVDVARGLFAEMPNDQARILLAHWSVGGAETPTGVPVELFREPVLPLEALAAIGFDAIVLGHIHKPQLLPAPPSASNGRSTPIFYVGSPMPLNFGEAESEHVAWLLDTESGPFQIPIVSRPLRTYDVHAREIGQHVGVDLPLDYSDAVVKLRIQATAEQSRRLDVAAIKRQLLEPREVASGIVLPAHKVWSVQVDVEREQIARGVEIDETVDDVEAFKRWLDVASPGTAPASVVVPRPFLADLLDAHRDYLTEAAS